MCERVEAKNPLYALRIVDCDDLTPRGFSETEIVQALNSLAETRNDYDMLMESATFDEVDAYYNPGVDDVCLDYILEAIVVDKFSKTDRRMAAVVRVLNRHLADSEVKALDPIIGNPRKTGAFAYVTVQLPFSDGQVVSVIFHAPEGDRKKVAPNDRIIAFQWLLNKRDITQVVAPEEGSEISLETLAKRITQLVVKNSARFERTQKEAAEERKALEEAREAVKGAENRQRELMDSMAQASKDAETVEAQLSNTLALLEKQRTINAELQAKLDALRKAKKGSGAGAGTEDGKKNQSNDILLELPITNFRPEEMRVVHARLNGKEWYQVQTRRSGHDWVTQKEHETQQAAIDDANQWYTPDTDADGATNPSAFVKTLKDILAGKYDSDTDRVDSLLDEAAGQAEASGRFEEFEALFNQAADHLTELLKKKQGAM